jgi:hypothetical protein
MSYKITRTVVRPNNSTSFYEDHADTTTLASYIQDTYISTNKMIEKTTTISDDGLTSVTEITWDSSDSWNEFLTDGYLMQAYFMPSKLYEGTHGMFSTFVGA